MESIPTSRAGTNDSIRTKSQSSPSTGKHGHLFLAKVILQIFERTGALKGLSDEEATLHVCHLVTEVMKELIIPAKDVLHKNKAVVLAKRVVKDLEEKYDDRLTNILLEKDQVLSVLIPCLQKHMKETMKKKMSRKAFLVALSAAVNVCIIGFTLLIVFLITGVI